MINEKANIPGVFKYQFELKILLDWLSKLILQPGPGGMADE